ncbi:3'-5' exonuclease, partial [Bacillus pseudomycoides]
MVFIQNYKGHIQLRVKQIRVANANEVTDISDFVEKEPVKKEDMVEKITQYIFEMRNPNIQRLT